ncbi:MAG: hypothetical protein DRN06_01460 [Thermoprotei archaeon]|nr:MAG: hypothetical protein DRN06_01460 [Thermoprotei archaeon]
MKVVGMKREGFGSVGAALIIILAAAGIYFFSAGKPSWEAITPSSGGETRANRYLITATHLHMEPNHTLRGATPSAA